MEEQRRCLYCGEPLLGRIDKKFCCDSCRSSYNYEKNHKVINIVRNINAVLSRNYNILCELNANGKTFVTRKQMNEKGFNFKYFTHLYTTKNGSVYHFVYDQAYVQKEKDRDGFVLVKNAEL